MLSFTGSLRIFVALESCDMRKGFNGLLALVSERLGEDVRGGAIFVFSNRRHTRLKMLYFDGTGLWLLSKRLESGSFSWPKSAEPGQRCHRSLQSVPPRVDSKCTTRAGLFKRV
jgi:transposase